MVRVIYGKNCFLARPIMHIFFLIISNHGPKCLLNITPAKFQETISSLLIKGVQA